MLTAVLEPVELTMMVSPNRTMLPPIWVDACDSQRRRNPLLRKTASGPASAGSGGDLDRHAAGPLVRGVTAAVRPGSPRVSNATSRRSRWRRSTRT